MKLRIEAEVRPTESREKVEAAVKKIFPALDIGMAGDKLVGESTEVSTLHKLHHLLRRRMILDAARSTMFAGKRENTVRFMLNKQAAFMGKVSFTGGESPLGPITVTLEAPDVEKLIDYLAPRTKDGKPLEEIEYP